MLNLKPCILDRANPFDLQRHDLLLVAYELGSRPKVLKYPVASPLPDIKGFAVARIDQAVNIMPQFFANMLTEHFARPLSMVLPKST